MLPAIEGGPLDKKKTSGTQKMRWVLGIGPLMFGGKSHRESCKLWGAKPQPRITRIKGGWWFQGLHAPERGDIDVRNRSEESTTRNPKTQGIGRHSELRNGGHVLMGKKRNEWVSSQVSM